MRTCQSCGKENPMDQDFCSCGEYLRWEPTGYMQAVTPEMAAEAKAAPTDTPAAPPEARVTPAVPVTPGHGNGNGNGHTGNPTSHPQHPSAPPPPPPSSSV